MRETRIHTNQPLACGTRLLLESEPSHHLRKVLRLREGAGLKLFNGNGCEYAALLSGFDHSAAAVQVGELIREEPEPALRLHLILGISKGERMDFAIQKAVELGVTRITPLFSTRSMVQLKGERLEKRRVHWAGVLRAACEQSGRCRLPNIDTPSDLATGLRHGEADLRLLLHHQGAGRLHDLETPTSGVALLIGPEGGLAPAELEQAKASGYVPIQLGPRIMRTETAPIAALAAIQTLWGDFR